VRPGDTGAVSGVPSQVWLALPPKPGGRFLSGQWSGKWQATFRRDGAWAATPFRRTATWFSPSKCCQNRGAVFPRFGKLTGRKGPLNCPDASAVRRPSSNCCGWAAAKVSYRNWPTPWLHGHEY